MTSKIPNFIFFCVLTEIVVHRIMRRQGYESTPTILGVMLFLRTTIRSWCAEAGEGIIIVSLSTRSEKTLTVKSLHAEDVNCELQEPHQLFSQANYHHVSFSDKYRLQRSKE